MSKMITGGKAIPEVRILYRGSGSLLMMLHLLPSIKENVEELSEGHLDNSSTSKKPHPEI